MGGNMQERVLITGGASGIGGAIAERCAQDGYETVVLDKQGEDISVDLASAADTRAALAEAVGRGPIHRLVNNVGIARNDAAIDVQIDDLDAVMAVNVRCAIQCVQAVYPAMRERGFGRIVNISSRALLGKPGRTIYSASKAALIGMTRTWALEFGNGVTANAIAPGPIDTPLFRAVNPPGPREALIDSIPVGRIGQPEDIANAASFLLDERSGYVSGQTLFVCGGVSTGNSVY